MLVLTDEFADKDLIGHEIYRNGLVEVIRSVKSHGSFTIGIYGQWGSGKTSILKQIKAAFDYSKSEDDKPVLTVWFNPWQFVAEKHLIVPFFHTLKTSLDKIATESTIEKIKRELPGFLNILFQVLSALMYGMGGGQIPSLISIKDELSIQTEAKDDKNKDYESIYYNLIQTLFDAAVEMDLKIVVFIDDLDRCLPEKAVELLEGLKVLMDLPNFIFVVGMAQEVIERGIRVRYKELYLADKENDLPDIEVQYLDKIIQFPFTLPAADPDKLKKNIIIKNLDEINIDKKFCDLIYDVLGSNPRTLKRFINAISFSIHLAGENFRKNGDFHPELLIKISLIGYLFPSLYRQLEKYPNHLVKLEEIVNKIDEERKKKKDDEDKGIVGNQGTQNKKTGLHIIDQWLEGEKYSKLLPILTIQEMGFKDKETVNKYVHLMSSSLQSEVTSKVKDNPIRNKTIYEVRDRMVEIPAGKFTMGDQKLGCREVTITRSFLMDKYPVTQDLYQKVMYNNPSHFKGEDRPVENITWFDAINFCNELSKTIGLQEAYEVNGEILIIKPESDGFRLPTEAEWEYACRATNGECYGILNEIAWYGKNSENQTQPVGQKKENKFGLYDMLGNVWEWCYDWYADYPKKSETNPIGPDKGSSRIMRGGSWVNFASTIKSTHRGGDQPNIRDYNLGFRLVLPLNQRVTEEQ